MRTTYNNHLVVDLNKVAYAVFFWRNQHSETNRLKPRHPTAHCSRVYEEDYAWPYSMEYPAETAIERARRLEVLDKWIPVVRLRLACADVVEFTGKKAVEVWKAWKYKIYGKQHTQRSSSTRSKARSGSLTDDVSDGLTQGSPGT